MANEADWPNLAAMMFGLAARRGERPMLRYHDGAGWRTISWRGFAGRVASLARGLRAGGVAAGDRVLLVSENRPEVTVVETAVMAIRAVPVPGYTTNTIEDHAHLLRDSGARAAVVSTPELANRVRSAGELDRLWCMADPAFAALMEDGAGPEDIASEVAMIPDGALACLIYTSGTSGLPRGVMLPHRAILSNIAGVAPLARPLRLDGSVYLSYLPLSHSFEHTVGQFIIPAMGGEVAFGRGVEHLAADMDAVQPTILTVVPRILEVMRARTLAQVARAKPLQRRLFHAALAAGERRVDGTDGVADRVLAPVLDRLVRAKVRRRFGGRLVALVSGGARLDPALSRFWDALGLPVLQGYGQTEAGPVVSVNPPGRARNHTVGPPLHGVAVRIAGDGEVLLQGGLVMDGYWNQPAATKAAVRDGWLHTGDVGRLEEDGFLVITDRKKDIIVLSGGENVSPARVEALLMAQPEIMQAVVGGDGQAGLFALLVPGEGDVSAAVRRVNERLSVTERIRRHSVVGAFTVENGLLTPSQKIKRSAVLRAHA